ncbi:YbjN domain-containing protein [Asanoa sp. NPDC050611]|uniref:YbjN domain-containing protein n=1 Tax=Asanoa sp. NPDC050611 TaxID=3157098 RepID=UPI0033F32A4E
MESPGGALLPLTNELIAGVLDGHGYAFAQDTDGDLVGRWDDNLIYFFRLGRDGEILQIRTLASRVFGIDDVLPLYGFCNGWNQDKLWPKAFVHVNDDGTVRVLGEVVADLEHGVTADQLDQLVACGISSGCQLADTLERLRL